MTPETVEKLEKERNRLEEQWKRFNEDLRSLLQEKKNNELPIWLKLEMGFKAYCRYWKKNMVCKNYISFVNFIKIYLN